MSGFNIGDYVDVKERLKLFYEKYPDGSIQFEFMGTLESNPEMIWGIATAYRTPDDVRPGVGTAAELALGKTTFTRGSELMNLETSAWGRAIAALGIGLGKSVATRQEVEAAQSRQSEDPWGEEQPVPESRPLPDTRQHKRPTGAMTEKQYGLIKSMFNYSFSEMTEWVNAWKERNGKHPEAKISSLEASQIIDELKIAGYVPVPNTKKTVDQESKD